MITSERIARARRTGVLAIPKCMSRGAEALLGTLYQAWCKAYSRPEVTVVAFGRGGYESIEVRTHEPLSDAQVAALREALAMALQHGWIDKLSVLWARTGDGLIVDGCYRGEGERVAQRLLEALGR